MISATAWIAKGKTARHPAKYAVDEAELERVGKLTNVHFEDAKEQFRKAQKVAQGWTNAEGDQADEEDWDDEQGSSEGKDEADANGEVEMEVDDSSPATATVPADDLSKYNLDTYDDDDDADNAMRLGPFSNIKGLQFHRSNDEDPYITLKNDPLEEEEEREDLEVQPTDNLIICAKTQDDVSSIEAYVYDAQDSNLFVHHDLMLPSFPLCLEWLDFRPAGAADTPGNFIAVGTMDPEIEIWNMDVVDGLFPDAILGRRDLTEALDAPKGTGKKKRKLPKERTPNDKYHVDAVLSLSWNRTARNFLASASADSTIKLWDLSRPAETTSTSGGIGALRSYNHIHADKVQSVAWDTSNSSRGAVSQPARLLSGGYDKRLCVFDSRAPNDAMYARLNADVECIRWNPWREHEFLASTEDGMLQSFDARTLSAAKAAQTSSSSSSSSSSPPLFTLSAHDGACTAVDVSPQIPGCILTGGTDKLIKVWNVEGQEVAQPGAKPSSISLVTSRDLDAGKLFTAHFSPDDPLTVVAGGSRGHLRVWDALSNVGVRKTFGARLRAAIPAMDEQLSGREPARGDGIVRIDDESDDDEGNGSGTG